MAELIRFKKGDIIVSDYTERLIVKTYKNHYKWKYINIDVIFDSKDSNDPLFEMGWSLKIKN